MNRQETNKAADAEVRRQALEASDAAKGIRNAIRRRLRTYGIGELQIAEILDLIERAIHWALVSDRILRRLEGETAHEKNTAKKRGTRR